jgi:CxxC-x17-CxxC domain-containing protein
MKDFKKSNGFGNRDRGGDRFPKRDFGGRPSFGGRNDRGGDDRGAFRPRPDMHKATCANCNKTCEVPFRPNGEKPVYCNDCFGNSRGDSKPNFNDRGDRPNREAYTPKREGEHRDTRIDDLKREVATIQTKLDRLMELLKENGSSHKKVMSPEVSVQSETKTAKKAEKVKTMVVKKKPAAKKK